MSLSQNKRTVFLELKAAKHDIYNTKFKTPVRVFLHFVLDGEKIQPIKLGTGRSAVVLVASEFTGLNSGAGLYAVKFLREDPDPQYSEASAARFFSEAEQMQQWGRDNGYLVNYVGWGAIAKNTKVTSTNGGVKEFWWGKFFKEYDAEASNILPNMPVLDNNNETFQWLKESLSLQGPFYIMEFCQGTLEDLLDSSEPWSELPAYRWIDKFAEGLKDAQASMEKDIEFFHKHYLDPKKPKKSGYEILNSFHINKEVPVTIKDGRGEHKIPVQPSRIRTYAVLQLFEEIAGTVANLHRGNRNQLGLFPLVHRDIKPGNLFFQHPFNKLTELSIRLSDLGYVASWQELLEERVPGKFTEAAHLSGATLGNRRGIVYQAPGSQFYRAPEQAELPIEVWLSVYPNQRNRVHVRGAKLSGIEVNDWLIIDDLQRRMQDCSFEVDEDGGLKIVKSKTTNDLSDESNNTIDPSDQKETKAREEQPIFSILRVDWREEYQDVYELTLNQDVPGDELFNLHGQITKSTGFHTDGYSLGAILYDLISGGKNPEHFYTYCQRVFTKEFTLGKTNENFERVEDITDILAPETLQRLEKESGKTDIIPGFVPKVEFTPLKGLRPETTHRRPSWSKTKTVWAALWSNDDPDVLLDKFVDILYRDQSASDSLEADIPKTWGDVWKLARTAGDGIEILQLIADLVYRTQPLENKLTWQSIWEIVQVARTSKTADEFLDHVTAVIYEEQKAEEKSIWHIVNTARGGVNADDFLYQIASSIYLDRSSEKTEDDRRIKIRNLRFRSFHVVEDLLRDKRGELIPREIIRLIVSCMMRTIDNSFYRSDDKDGYYSLANTQAALEIQKRAAELMQTDFPLEEGSVPHSLIDNILFGLRCLSSENVDNSYVVPQSNLNSSPGSPHSEDEKSRPLKTELLPSDERSVGTNPQETILMATDEEQPSGDQTQE